MSRIPNEIKKYLLENAESTFDNLDNETDTSSTRSRRVYHNVEHLIKHVENVEVPDTIKKLRQQRKENAEKSGLHDTDEDVTYVISGRGKGIKDRIVKPGCVVEYHPTDDDALRKKIREVSGLGYSNEFIEQSFETTRNVEIQSSSSIGLKFVPATKSDVLRY